MTIRKRRHIARTKSKAHVNDYVKFLILDKKDSFLLNIFFVSLQPKKVQSIAQKISSYKFSTAPAL